jgi:glycosyltransferase involved in cell wall biosynthesis
VRIERKISISKDIKAVAALFILFRKHKYAVVHSVTPKAGFLAMSAGFFAGVPSRVHIFTGQVWATKHGFKRFLLRKVDTLTATLATHVLVDSHSQRDFLVGEGAISREKSLVLHKGSIAGVNTDRFRPSEEYRKKIRKSMNIDDSAFIFLFIGRLNKDKGVLDLAEAFSQVGRQFRSSCLVMIGEDEENLSETIYNLCGPYKDRVYLLKHTESPEKYMAASDVLVLPSYREGFGVVVIEAAACGIPTIGARIYGVTDAVEDGATGLLYSCGEVAELAEKMIYCIENTVESKKMGQKARERVAADFTTGRITSAILEFYATMQRSVLSK